MSIVLSRNIKTTTGNAGLPNDKFKVYVSQVSLYMYTGTLVSNIQIVDIVKILKIDRAFTPIYKPYMLVWSFAVWDDNSLWSPSPLNSVI